MKSRLTKCQFKTEVKTYIENGITYRIQVKIRFDDQCGNGHNTFSITGDIDRKSKNGRWVEERCGCIHDEIVKHFPHLQEAIQYHLVSTDGSMYYIANTIYLASDRDCWGLKKGETKQIKNSRTGKLCWILEDNNTSLEEFVYSDTQPEGTIILKYKPYCRIGEGKEPDLDAARRTAIWPEATLEQLQDKEALEKHWIDVEKRFIHIVKSFGFIY